LAETDPEQEAHPMIYYQWFDPSILRLRLGQVALRVS